MHVVALSLVGNNDDDGYNSLMHDYTYLYVLESRRRRRRKKHHFIPSFFEYD